MWLFVTESWWGMDDVQDEEMMAMLMYQVSEDGEIRPGEGGTSAAVPHVATYIKSGYGGEEESQA